ncbi:hypothetical protein XH96_03400 [Bradyrhizobium sp. CCBAU 51765]|nr:hypothetical protein XH96_03400 [Bradyrhizobium sp. CCBAU 51765]
MASARSRRRPWFEIAEILAEWLEAAPDGSAASRIRERAAEATELSQGVLRRYVSVLSKLRAIARKEGIDLEDLVSMDFNPSEVAVRIHDRNPAEGLKALQNLKAGAATLASLRERLATVPVDAPGEGVASKGWHYHDSSLTKLRTTHVFMEQALQRHSPLLTDPSMMLRARPPVGFAAGGHGSLEIAKRGALPFEVVAGVELLVYENGPVRAVERDFPAFALLATLYPRFDLVFSPTTDGGFVDAVRALIDAFRTRSIGIMQVTPDGALDTIVEPSGPPTPDRRSAYEKFFPMRRPWKRDPGGDSTGTR